MAFMLIIALVGAVGLTGLLAVPAYAQGPWPQGGWGCGVMGGWGSTYPEGTKLLTIDEAKLAVDRYLSAWNNADLEVVEVMEFSENFYALVKEKSTGLGAFEVLVDKATGTVRPEPGPNMMWNLKYGMMGGRGMMGGWGYGGMMGGWGPGYAPSAQMSVDDVQARQNAQSYLDRTMPGATLSEHTATFYGYYTIDVEQDGHDVGMLSVNGYTGQVWYHTWHGTFVQEKEWD
ncbi:MAG: hypothetical protein KKA73_23070 [Chloroflexi bacterium]|nr:hypothetical protein [Chloroflexota bacterium]MBU1750573.1 hypothetical protein [Chloroflexota bacterium]MBU1878952.1 hypothetical protein [Chloroflexota bacterium]